jgi:hypothetical protein
MLSSDRNRVTSKHFVEEALRGVHRARRTPRGREEFIFEKSFGSEFEEIPETKGMHGISKYSRR